jgi:hypothetical protein
MVAGPVLDGSPLVGFAGSWLVKADFVTTAIATLAHYPDELIHPHAYHEAREQRIMRDKGAPCQLTDRVHRRLWL